MFLENFRKDFPMLKRRIQGKPLIYLDTAATAQKPQVVIDTISEFYQNQYGTVHRTAYELCAFATQQYEQVREQVRRLLNASKVEEIIFTKGTTESINLVAHSFGKKFIFPGDEILISAMEHHANIVPWQMACEERGAELKVIPMNSKGELDLEAYQALLNDCTKLVAVAHISNSTGTLNPIKQICQMAHKAGAKILVDGAQSAPHMPVDVKLLDADFFVFSGHKMYGPTGIGILYGKEELLNAMPPYQGGGDMVDKVTFEKTTYNKLPLKFEAGTPPIAEVIGLGAAIEFTQKVGLSNIEHHEKKLLENATQLLIALPGIRLIGTAKEKGAIITFVAEGVHALDIGSLLDIRGVAIRTGTLCAQTALQFFGVDSVCRASFAFYNTAEEVTLFIESLKEALKILR